MSAGRPWAIGRGGARKKDSRTSRCSPDSPEGSPQQLVSQWKCELIRSSLDRFRTRIPNLISNTLRLQHLDASAAEEAIRMPLQVYQRQVTPHLGRLKFTFAPIRPSILLRLSSSPSVPFSTRRSRGHDPIQGCFLLKRCTIPYCRWSIHPFYPSNPCPHEQHFPKP